MGFADCDELYLISVSPDSFGRMPYSSANCLNICPYLSLHKVKYSKIGASAIISVMKCTIKPGRSKSFQPFQSVPTVPDRSKLECVVINFTLAGSLSFQISIQMS